MVELYATTWEKNDKMLKSKFFFWLMLGMEAWGRSMPYEVRGNLGGGGQEKGYGDNSDK